jgi:small subunit ribosomal protein SAe
MSGVLDVLQMKEEDVLKFLAAGTQLGGTNLDFQMEQYIYKRKSDVIYIHHSEEDLGEASAGSSSHCCH